MQNKHIVITEISQNTATIGSLMLNSFSENVTAELILLFNVKNPETSKMFALFFRRQQKSVPIGTLFLLL